jgi:hypothetical protein
MQKIEITDRINTLEELKKDRISSNIRVEDGGCAIIANLSSENEENIHVTMTSWDEEWETESESHKKMKEFLGKKVKITIKVIE